jgi:DNA polymerase-3 subunit gamma/tau
MGTGAANGSAAGVTGAKAAGAAGFAKALCVVALPAAIAGSVALAPHGAVSPPARVAAAMATATPPSALRREPIAPQVATEDRREVALAVDPPAVVTASKPARVTQPAPRREAPAAPAAESALGAESALVVSARAALRSGDCSTALSRLDGARTSFAAGALDEEREAMAIEALACSGRPGEASTRASEFLRLHPQSLHAGFVQRFVR